MLERPATTATTPITRQSMAEGMRTAAEVFARVGIWSGLPPVRSQEVATPDSTAARIASKSTWLLPSSWLHA